MNIEQQVRQQMRQRFQDAKTRINRLKELRSAKVLAKRHGIKINQVHNILHEHQTQSAVSDDVRSNVINSYLELAAGEQKLANECNIATLAREYHASAQDVKTVLQGLI